MLKLLERDTITVRGARSTFQDLASEQTSFPDEVCEMPLAHVNANTAEVAIRCSARPA
jgi:hypothetical protein